MMWCISKVSPERKYRSRLSFLYSGIDWKELDSWLGWPESNIRCWVRVSLRLKAGREWLTLTTLDRLSLCFIIHAPSGLRWSSVSVDSTHISSGYPPSVRWDSVDMRTETSVLTLEWGPDLSSVSGNQSPGEVRWEGAQEQDGELLPPTRGGGALPWAPAEARHWPGVEKVSPLRAWKYFGWSFVNILTVQYYGKSGKLCMIFNCQNIPKTPF